MQRGILGVVCALVAGFYACAARPGFTLSRSLNPANAQYNLLVQGYRAGHLSLKKEVPPEFARLPDPYDPIANEPYRIGNLHDLSYYKGRLYIYFGVTPAVLLFWPYVALTGHYMLQRNAVVIFCMVGFLASVGLFRALWRRYFAEVNAAVAAAGALALGLATGTPVLLARCDVYEVPISCGYALTMLALAAIWKALHESGRRCRWLAAASLTYGLAVAARPTLLFGAVVLLVPVAQAWRERRTLFTPLLAAVGPTVLVGLGLLLYNALRFDNPFEFGMRYLLIDIQPRTQKFSPQYLWFNFRLYFLEPTRWSARFPFVDNIAVPPLPAGHGRVEQPFGVLTNIPLVWLALVVPLAWRRQAPESRSILRWFATAVGMLFGICALTICLFFGTCFRYEVEFLPALVLLAVMGIVGSERVVAPNTEWGQAVRSDRRRAIRWVWSLLLGFSVAFNLLASLRVYTNQPKTIGVALVELGRMLEAMGHCEQALPIKTNLVCDWGNALLQAGKAQEAIGRDEQALQIRADNAEIWYNHGNALLKAGRVREAIRHYEVALQNWPDYAEAHYNLGLALERAGRVPDAIQQYEQALQIKPDFLQAENALARARTVQ
jgi:tetratricopeptide (TPR) repeat protein